MSALTYLRNHTRSFPQYPLVTESTLLTLETGALHKNTNTRSQEVGVSRVHVGGW